jgi:hypothetical protein
MSQETRDFYAYSDDIFQNGKNYLKSEINTFFGRFNEKNNIFLNNIKISNNYRIDDFNNKLNMNSKFKILIIGDSYVAGFDSKKSWCSFLRETLKETLDIEIYNLGLPGTGPVNWIEYKNKIDELKPDFIIIGLVNNILLRPLIGFLCRNNLFYSQYENDLTLCKGIISKHLKEIDQEEIFNLSIKFNNAIKNEKLDKSKILSEKYFDRNVNYLKELCIMKKTLLVQFPTYNSFDTKDTIQEIQLEQIKKDLNIELLYIRNFLSSNDKNELYIISGDHLNLSGNKKVAKIINSYLQKSINFKESVDVK